ncbi:MAG: NAD-dependent dehydratase [Actinobacteria bacterium]|nr:NAD-dependent dehydratase [Actinomycetota bacterium]
MKVLIVGGAGYVGGGIVDLLGENHEIKVYDSLIYEESYRKDVPFVYGDIRDQDLLKQQLNWADAVIWLAALVGDGACAINPKLTFEINANSLDWLKKNFQGRIVFLSTCSVYGAQDAILNEESETNPLSEYASSKLKAEEALNDTDSIIFRLGTLFGVSDTFARIRLDLVVNVLVTKALLEKKMSVFGGEQWRPLLHVNDVASAIDKTLDSSMKGIYNLHYKNYKIIEIAEEITKKVPDSVIETTPMPFQDSRNYRVSSDKLINESNFKPSFDLSVGIDEIYNLISEKRIKDVNDPRYSNQSFLQRYGVS